MRASAARPHVRRTGSAFRPCRRQGTDRAARIPAPRLVRGMVPSPRALPPEIRMLLHRWWVALAIGVVLARAGTAGALPNQFSETRIFEKAPGSGRPPTITAARPQQGDDFEHPFMVPGLPFAETGTTCGFRDDVLAPCTFLGGAPDVVYTYTPATAVVVDVDLCDSGYDTALHVYSGPARELVGCSDDACGNGARIAGLELQAGVAYYFVIDGWYGGCGSYALSLTTDPLPCPLPPAPGAALEGEPDCAPDRYDSYNRGCNDFPYVFTPVSLGDSGITVQGTYGTFPYYLDDFRDTDWYEVQFDAPAVLECVLTGGAASQLAILDGREGCGDWSVVSGPVLGPACDSLVCQAPLEPGRYWIFVATRWFTGVRCGTPYVLRLRRYPGRPVAVQPASWSRVKEIYR